MLTTNESNKSKNIGSMLFGAIASRELDSKCIHKLFEEQVEKNPQSVAVIDGDKYLTYQDLNDRANQLAHYLQTLGVKAEVLVGICVKRSPASIVGLLGILKAGGAYVPLDPSYPPERLAFMLADSQVSVLLTESKLLPNLPEHNAKTVCLDSDWQAIAQQPKSNPISDVNPGNLIYVMYTSGSTGQPKGVAIEHRAVHRLVVKANYISIQPTDAIAQVSNNSFDAATFEIWGALVNGSRLVIINKDIVLAAKAFADVLVEQQISVLFLTTALFNQLAREVPSAFSSVRHVLFGGEAVDPSCVKSVLKYGSPERLIHVYGPTESTTFATWYLIKDVPEGVTTIPIGFPISQTSCHVLDDQLQPVPTGAIGELYIGGIGLGRAYLNRPDLTVERFIPNPFSNQTQERLYKTGDLVRRLPDGSIEYAGRRDRQVKLRGFRIELGEIESLLRQHPTVRDCVVLMREDTSNNKYLAAYVAVSKDQNLTARQLRQFSQQHLPEYMMPRAFVLLESFPLTPNGKLDRQALPVPELSCGLSELDCVIPRTLLEEKVAALWSQVLGVEHICIYDSFLELGGHSLLAMQIVGKVSEVFQVQLSVDTLFTAPTVAEFAQLIETTFREESRFQLPAIKPVKSENTLPLSWSQQQMWLLAQLEPNIPYYNDTVTLRFNGSLNIVALEQSLNEIIRRHAVLRTSFVAIAGQPQQVVRSHLPFKLSVVDLQSLPPDARENQALQVALIQAQQNFDLTQAPLLRATLVHLSETKHRLYLTLHHIIYDGISLYRVFLKELTVLYDAFCTGKPSTLPELAIQYYDFAVWQQQHLHKDILKPGLEYWKHKLVDLPTLRLPTNRSHQEAITSFKGSQQHFNLSRELTEQLKTMSRTEGVTLFTTLMATLKILLYRYTGQIDIPVATVTAGRNQPEVENLIGCFVNTLILRTELSGDLSFRELLKRVQQVTLEAYAHQDIPFQKILEELRRSSQLGQQPFQVLFVLAPAIAEIDTPWHLSQQEVNSGTTKCDLYFELEERPSGIAGRIEYSTELFDADSITRLIGHLKTLLLGIVTDPDQLISTLPLLTAAEQQQVMECYNPPMEFSLDACLHQLFADRVLRSPYSVAVVFGLEQLTYQQLDWRANQLAHYLQQKGVRPDVLVGLCVDRGIDLVVAILGILKAGGAYVPLDPLSPKERLAAIIADMQPALLVTESHLKERLPAHAANAVYIDTDYQVIAQAPHTTPKNKTTPDNLAYVIYTSGSTGKPKGVLINHSNVVRLFSATQPWYQFNHTDVWTLFHSYAFDFSVWELWGALLYGGRLIVVPHCVTRSPDAFKRLLHSERVTVLNQTPSAFRQLMRAEELSGVSEQLALRLVIFGGEALNLMSLQPWFERRGDQYPQLVNMYGITETTVHVTYRRIVMADLQTHTGSVIGQPIPDLQVYILDQHLQPVPIGVPGEMYISGAGLGRGYLNRPELTAERFISNPFSNQSGARFYKSGDLARRLPNGDIEYLGRIDNQVKIRGFRIELGEVEYAIGQHPNVRECVAVVREDVPGDRRLIGYFTVAPNTTLPVSDLHRFLQQKLPEYMVPNVLMMLETLPLTLNGKVNFKLLPTPDVRPELEACYVAPRTKIEEQLVKIWSAVLGVENVGIHDRFLELGGHSLLATQLMARVNEVFQVLLPVHSLFTAPTVAELALAIEQHKNAIAGSQILDIVSVTQQAPRIKLSALKEEQASIVKKMR